MPSAVADTLDKITQFIELKVEQLKLRMIEKISGLLANVISLSIALFATFFFIFFLSFALAYLLNAFLSSTYLGFFIVCGFYLLVILILLFLLRKKIIQGWFESLIHKISETQNEDEED